MDNYVRVYDSVIHNCKEYIDKFYSTPKHNMVHEEKKDEHNNEGPGAICFQYGEQLPFSISRYWRMPDEGMLVVFPAWIQHYVHSFTSDVERISVSGNIRFKFP